MILEFSFSNFGPVKEEVTLSFEASKDSSLEDFYITKMKDGQRVLKIGLIYGPNASGKTNVLKALGHLKKMVVSPLDQKKNKIEYKRFQLDKRYSNLESKFRIKFYYDGIKYDYKVSFDNNSIFEEALDFYPNLRKANVFTRETKDGVSKISFGSTVDAVKKDQIVLQGNTLHNVTVLGAYSKSNLSTEIAPFESVYSWFSEKLTPMISPMHSLDQYTNEKLDEGEIDKFKLIQLLQNADLNITDLEIVDEETPIDDKMRKILDLLASDDDTKEELRSKESIVNKNVLFKHEVKRKNDNSQKMELDNSWESSGTMRYYGLTGAILATSKLDKILLVDELDHSLHPDLMKHLILSYLQNTHNSQLLFTTHNVSFLMERDIIRNDAVWFTEKDDSGATDLFSLAEFKSSEFRKDGSIYNAYSLGKLGAKPNLTGSFLKQF